MTEPEEINLELDLEPEPEQQYVESDGDFICFDTDQVDAIQNQPE